VGWIAASLLGLFACASNADTREEPKIEELFPERCATSICAVGPTITSANELVSIIEATSSWVAHGPYTTGCLPASAEIRVLGTLTVQTDQIAVPTVCEPRSDCRKAVRFRVTNPLPPGVECVRPEAWYAYSLCPAITLRDATIRLRPVLEDIHPSSFGNFAPIVDVLPPCSTPCTSEELACPATHTCWADVRDHCAYCLGGDNEACACWNGSSFESDGTACDLATSGDVIELGTCRAGRCDTTRRP
jgi:hypothetical protein